MSQRAGGGNISRRDWLLAGLSLGVSPRARSPLAAISARYDGDNIHVTAHNLHFLSGKPLERLKNGLTVVFLSQLSISLDGYRTTFRRLPERFTVSYDLWGEKFSVARMSGIPRSISHLSAEAAEAWCLESMAVSAAGLDPGRQFWLRLEMRAADPKEEEGVVGEPGINITRLIELFSRRPRPEQPHWRLDAGPLRLADLRGKRAEAARAGEDARKA